MRYELLIFDWDGTLMDSIGHIVESLHYAMKKSGVELLPEDQTKDIIGLGLREAIQTLFPEQSKNSESFIQEFSKHYRDHYLDPSRRTQFFHGVVPALETLNKQGFKLAVATGKTRHGLDILLRETQTDSLFDSSRCADETRSKPHPAMVFEILEELKVEPDKALMVGDTEYDLEMARNAKIDSVGVTYGVHDIKRLEKHAPICLIDHVDELVSMLVN